MSGRDDRFIVLPHAANVRASSAAAPQLTRAAPRQAITTSQQIPQQAQSPASSSSGAPNHHRADENVFERMLIRSALGRKLDDVKRLLVQVSELT
jgi:hypothetical protein